MTRRSGPLQWRIGAGGEGVGMTDFASITQVHFRVRPSRIGSVCFEVSSRLSPA
ncbi:hypothetical protein [Rhodobacter thermarum]|uniref:hypothetical protein n=1 Tax=Tabrizicola thermarum TaxID=2670345 RepID=UPI0013900593